MSADIPLSDDRLALFHARWDQSAGMEDSLLLRLAILRDLVRELHAEKSRLLAVGKQDRVQDIRSWEKRADALKNAAQLEGGLLDVLNAPEGSIRKRTRLLPEALFSIHSKEAFSRYDRTWESAIAAEACQQGWRFWRIDAWVSIKDAETWHAALSNQILPHGIVLFVESVPEALDASASPVSDEIWHGYWHVILKPRFLTPNFHIRELPGVSLEPAAPQWKLLFSSTKR